MSEELRIAFLLLLVLTLMRPVPRAAIWIYFCDVLAAIVFLGFTKNLGISSGAGLWFLLSACVLASSKAQQSTFSSVTFSACLSLGFLQAALLKSLPGIQFEPKALVYLVEMVSLAVPWIALAATSLRAVGLSGLLASIGVLHLAITDNAGQCFNAAGLVCLTPSQSEVLFVEVYALLIGLLAFGLTRSVSFE